MTRRRAIFMLVLKILLVVLGLGATALFLLVWAYQNWGIYEFDTTRAEPSQLGLANVRVVRFVSEDGFETSAWIAPPRDDRPVLLCFFGGFTSIGPSAARMQPLLDQGYGMAMLVYRSSSGEGGEPSEAAFTMDARALYDQLDSLLGLQVPANRRVLHGFSLGTSIAAGLAAERPAAGIVIEAGFDRCCRWHTLRMRRLPMCMLMWRERHDVVDKLQATTLPKLFLHGGRDDAVPVAWSRALHDAVPGTKRFVVFELGGHSDLPEHGAMAEVAMFLDALPH